MKIEAARRGGRDDDRYIDPFQVLKRVLGAAYFGIFVTCCTLAPSFLNLARGPYPNANEGFSGTVAGLVGVSVLLFPFAVVVTLPLVLFVIIVAVTCRQSVYRHTAIWSAAAPFAVWFAALAILDLLGLFQLSRLFGDTAWNAVTSVVSLLFLAGSIPSAVIFYWIWRRGERAAATSSD